MVAPKKEKPKKPNPSFPLTANSSGSWVAKIKGKVWVFGRWDDPDGALQRYAEWKPIILRGDDPRARIVVTQEDQSGFTVKDLCNAFLTVKQTRVESGKMTRKMFAQYKAATDLIVEGFGRETLVDRLGPNEFARLMATFPSHWGTEMLSGTVGRIRSVFKFAVSQGMVKNEVKFGEVFRRPDKLQRRREKQQRLADTGRLDLDAPEIRTLLKEASPQIKACILLGINAGLGNTDCALLTKSMIDFESGWVHYPRPKTGIERRFKLWPETLEALKTVIEKRHVPNDPSHENLVFVTADGNPLVWDRMENGKLTAVNGISRTFGRLLLKTGLKRKGVNFYSLRRSFETLAGETLDQTSIDIIMGHEDSSMASVYRQGLGRRGTGDKRIELVLEHVRTWLFGEGVSDGD